METTRQWHIVWIVALIMGILAPISRANPLTFDVVFVSSPRHGDTVRSKTPDVDSPLGLEPGTNLMLLRAGQTVPEVLVDTHGIGAVAQPFVGYTGTDLYFSMCEDMSAAGVNKARDFLPLGGCNLWHMPLATRVPTRFVDQTAWRPNGSVATWSKRPEKADPPGTTYLGYGLIHTSPVPLPNGDVFFISSLSAFDAIKGFLRPSMQAYIWYKDTGTIEQVWYPPTTLLDAAPLSYTGEISFATLENSLPGSKPHRWGIWSMLPDGRAWRPLFSATMEGPHTRHFHTEYNGNLVSSSYYLTNNNALGTIIQRPLFYGTTPSAPEFGSFIAKKNTPIQMGATQKLHWAYKPAGTDTLTPWAHTFDRASDKVNGVYLGKVGFPWAAPNGILVSYSSGPANLVMRPVNTPMPQLGIYLLPEGLQTDSPADLQLVYDDPQRNEFWARPIVPYKAIYGVDTPTYQPTRPPGDGTVHVALPPGTPYGLIGTSSVWHRESCGGQWTAAWQCSKPVYSVNDDAHSNRAWQGVDTMLFKNTDIAALRIIVQGGVSHLSYGPGSSGQAVTRTFVAHAGNERLHVLGDVPLYKKNAQGATLLDPMGNPDTSFLARIPADVSFGFQLVDAQGMALTQPGTWHQLRPGEMRNNCGGCHAHSQNPLPFSETAAGKPGFVPHDLTQQQPWTKEWHRDIRPILDAKCVSCHTPTQQRGALDLATTTLERGLPRNWRVLADDQAGALSGVKPISPYVGRASRYIAHMAAAESPLAWVVAHRRLDGVSNAARPTETTPGDVSTLPPGTHRSLVDIDYLPAVHAAHAGVQLTAAEQETIIHWIDIGAPIDLDAARGWMVDEHKPTLAWHDSGAGLTLGVHDVGSGLALPSLTVTRDGVAVTPHPLGAGRWSVPRQAGRYHVVVADVAGNRQEFTRLVAPVPVSAAQTLYEGCGLLIPWTMLSPAQHVNWEACAQ